VNYDRLATESSCSGTIRRSAVLDNTETPEERTQTDQWSVRWSQGRWRPGSKRLRKVYFRFFPDGDASGENGFIPRSMRIAALAAAMPNAAVTQTDVP